MVTLDFIKDVLPKSHNVLLPLLGMRSSAKFRETCRGACTNVALYPWESAHMCTRPSEGWGPSKVRTWAQCLGKCFPNVRSLDLDDAGIGDEEAKALAASLPLLSRLEQLTLTGNDIGDEGMKALAAALPHLPGLLTLRLCENRIGDEGLTALSASLVHLPKLSRLNLNGNRIRVGGAKALAAALHSVHFLQLLGLDPGGEGHHEEDGVGDEGMLALAASLSGVPHLETLFLGSSHIGPMGMKALAGALKHVPSLDTLHVSDNYFGDEGMLALAPFLYDVPELTCLDLSFNGIGTPGIRALAAALPGILELTDLNVGDNIITREGMLALATALSDDNSPCLQELSLGRCNIDDNGMQTLAGALEYQPELTRIYAYDNPIGTVGIKALAASAAHLPCLELLYFGTNNSTPATDRAVVAAILSKHRMTHVQVHY